MSEQAQASKVTTPWELEPSLQQSYALSCERVESLARQNERLVAALKKIADADYRGNRSTESVDAYQALKVEGLA